MKNILLKTVALSLVASSAIYAGGYKIPETSTNAIALSAANIAHNKSADAAYYNPANMMFMKNENALEADLIYVGLSPVKFKGSADVAGTTVSGDISAQSESFILPSINYVSSEFDNVRVGLSISVPGGLSKRWNNSPAKDSAKEFTLEVVEVNPTVAFKLSKNLSMGLGFRAISSKGVVKSTSLASRDMTGDSLNYGYNLALSYRPINALEVALTYRSNVDLTEKGNAKLNIGAAKVYDGGANVTVPLPATLSLALAYTLSTKTTLEFVYEKNYWSAYSSLDFGYVSSIPLIIQPVMDAPIAKNWNDTNTYRLGITQELDNLTLMAGAVIDNSPVPDSSLSFELPDSNSLSLSFGGRYKLNDKMSIGLSTLYSMRDNRTIKAVDNNNKIDGKFSNADVLMVSAGFGYKF